jgi:hypothetical protein
MPPFSRPTVMGILVALGMIGAHPCSAQTRVTSLEELRRQLEAGNLVTVVAGDGQPVTGRLMRVGEDDLVIRPVDSRRTPLDRARATSMGISQSLVEWTWTTGTVTRCAFAIESNRCDASSSTGAQK